MARVEAYGAPGAAPPRGGARLPPGAVPSPVLWTKGEDDLLLAITHEFGINWTMVRAGRGSGLGCPGPQRTGRFVERQQGWRL
jgi:hypothetical protein